MLTSRQELILGKVIEGYLDTGQPVGSKWLSADPELSWGPSTIRNELAMLEEQGFLNHPHTSAGRLPTEVGYRYFVNRLLGERTSGRKDHRLELSLAHSEVDEAMRTASETLSQVTDLLAVVSQPSIESETVRHVEVVMLRPEVLAVVVITSTGAVTKRTFAFDRPVDSGLADWVGSYLNERIVGLELGSRMLMARLFDPSLAGVEAAFLKQIAPVFTELSEKVDHTLYIEGAARLVGSGSFDDISELNELMQMLEQRVALLGMLKATLEEPGVYVRIGHENDVPAFHSLALVAASYGLPSRSLGTVSVIGPLRMDYAVAIGSVREAAGQLSRFVTEAYADL